MRTTEEKLKAIQAEKERINNEIEQHEKTLPDLEAQITKVGGQLEEAINETTNTGLDGDDLDWLADDIIEYGSELAKLVRQLGRLKQ